MAISSSGVPLFDGIEDIDDMFIATMEERDKEVHEHIDIHDPVWAYLKKHNLIEYRSSIGTHKTVRLMDKENSTVKDFTHYDDADNTPQDVYNEAKFAYGHSGGVQMYSREELVKNSGDEQQLDMIRDKENQLTISLTNHVSTRLKGTQDADGRSVMGLGRIMLYDQPCGGVDPTQPGFAYWNPQRGLKTDGVTQFALATEMRAGMRRLVRLCTYQGERPTVWRMGEDLYDAAQAWAEDKLRMTLDEIKDSSGWGDHEMFTINGQTMIYDPDLDPKRGELFNFKRTRVRVHSGTNFQFTPWQMMEGKMAAKKRNCLVYYCVYTERRNANGYIDYT